MWRNLKTSTKFKYRNNEKPKRFYKQMALLKIQEIGQNETLSIVEEMRSKQVFDKKEYYSRLKSEINRLCKSPEITESSELINELDQKIKVIKVNLNLTKPYLSLGI